MVMQFTQYVNNVLTGVRNKNKTQFMTVVQEKIAEKIGNTVDIPAFIYAERKYNRLQKEGKFDIFGRLKIKKGEKW